MENIISRPRNELIAHARMRDAASPKDGLSAVIYTEDGTPIQDEIFPLGQIQEQLICNGATREMAEKFVRELVLFGAAELRQRVAVCWVTVG